MYGVISSRVFSEDILQAIRIEPIFFQEGEFEEDVFVQHCKAAGRVQITTLIIDIDSCLNESSIIKGVRAFKIARPQTRVLVVAVDRIAGNPTISDLVGLGVYDIVAPPVPKSEDEEDVTIEFDLTPYVKEQLQLNSTYADVARWHFVGLDVPVQPQTKNSKEKKVIQTQIEERIVIREKIVGTIIIAVAGVGRRTGTTHTAIQIANFLNYEGHQTACIELVDPEENPPTFNIFKNNQQSRLHPDGFTINNIDFFAIEHVNNNNIIDILKAGYKYVVLDLGNLIKADQTPAMHHQEFLRADMQIISSCSGLWDFHSLIQNIDTLTKWKWNKKWNVALHFADNELFQEIQAAITTKESEQISLNYFKTPYQPDPFKITEERAEGLYAMLEDVLPARQEPVKKGFNLKFWRKSS